MMHKIPADRDPQNTEEVLARVLSDTSDHTSPTFWRKGVLIPATAAATIGVVVVGGAVVLGGKPRAAPAASPTATASSAPPSSAPPSNAPPSDGGQPSSTASSNSSPSFAPTDAFESTEVSQKTMYKRSLQAFKMRQLLARTLDREGQHVPASDLDPTKNGDLRLISGDTEDGPQPLIATHVDWKIPGGSGLGTVAYGFAWGMDPCSVIGEFFRGVDKCEQVTVGGIKVNRSEVHESTLDSTTYAYQRSDGYVVALRMETSGGSGMDAFDFSDRQIIRLLKDEPLPSGN